MRKTNKNEPNLLSEEQIFVEKESKIPKIFRFKTHKVKDFFIPHHGNNHHPHLLHTRRAVFYGSFFMLVKVITVGFAALIPMSAFLAPDVIAEQREQLIVMVKNLRQEQNVNFLSINNKLNTSAYDKAGDMLENSYFSHSGPSGRDLAYFLDKVDYAYSTAGENLAMGFSTADQVMDAWIKSPLHYQNLIDTDFNEMGIGLTSGLYNDKETVFIAHHFGAPIAKNMDLAKVSMIEDELVFVKKAEAKIQSEHELITKEENNASQVLPQKVEMTEIESTFTETTEDKEEDFKPSIDYNKNNSRVYWSENNKKTTFEAKAYLSGDIASAFVYIQEYPIELKKDKFENGLYQGTLTVDRPSDDFFKVVIAPSIIVLAGDDSQLTNSIYWNKVKVVSPSPWEKYVSSKKLLPILTSKVFKVSSMIFMIALIIFSLILILTIVVEFRKQHPHIIVQTLSLIMLLAVLIAV